MKSYQLRKGFTLVEMLIVIAIIAILASVALVSVRGVRSSANDTKRISDMNKVQQKLEVYYTKNGNYPAVAYSGLGGALGDAVPADPSVTNPYKYGYSVDKQHYVLQATLAGDNNILKDPNIIKSGDGVQTLTTQGDAPACDTTAYQYCVGN